MTTTVELEGAREAVRALERAADELDDLDRTTAVDVAAYALERARWGAPRRTGTLAASGYLDTGGDVVAAVFGARYAPPVHSGVPSRNMPAQPFLDRAASQAEVVAAAQLERDVTAIARRAN